MTLIKWLRESSPRYDCHTGMRMYDVFCNRNGEDAARAIEAAEAMTQYICHDGKCRTVTLGQNYKCSCGSEKALAKFRKITQ